MVSAAEALRLFEAEVANEKKDADNLACGHTDAADDAYAKADNADGAHDASAVYDGGGGATA